MAENNCNTIKTWNGKNIRFREDGYGNLTDMAKATGKLVGDWLRLNSTTEYLQGLEADMGIPISKLVETKKGGISSEQGTWGHELVVTEFASWVSVPFKIQVNKWVHEIITTGKAEINKSTKESNNVEAMQLLQTCLEAGGLDAPLVGGVMLNQLLIYKPSMKPAVTEGHKLLIASNPKPLLLTPTTIGKRIGGILKRDKPVKASDINLYLLDMGFQVKNVHKSSKTEPSYLPTEIGKEFTWKDSGVSGKKNTNITAGVGDNGDNTTYQHTKWCESVIPEILKYLRNQAAA